MLADWSLSGYPLGQQQKNVKNSGQIRKLDEVCYSFYVDFISRIIEWEVIDLQTILERKKCNTEKMGKRRILLHRDATT